jgi:AraC-like DNA-binding protein
MDHACKTLDQNHLLLRLPTAASAKYKRMTMIIITPSMLAPVVRIANYHTVLPLQSWPQRLIPDLQLILIIKGQFLYSEDGAADTAPAATAVALAPGDLLWIEPARRHTFRSVSTQQEGLISGIHLELIADGAWAAGDYRLSGQPARRTQLADFAYMHERFRRCAVTFRSYLPHREQLTRAIACEILLLLFGHWEQATTGQGTVQLSGRMEELIAFIRANLARPLSRQVLAESFHLTPAHINLLFRRELGTTPAAVINRERVMTAYRLLNEEGCTVKEAAYAVGYQDPFYFSRVFKEILGIPPSQVG